MIMQTLITDNNDKDNNKDNENGITDDKNRNINNGNVFVIAFL